MGKCITFAADNKMALKTAHLILGLIDWAIEDLVAFRLLMT